jgi:hypothetical protein
MGARSCVVMEPRATVDLRTALMVRMEESSFRQVWRLSNLLIRIKSRTLEVVPPGNEGISNDVIENTALVPLNPTMYMKTKQIGNTSGAGS